MTAVYWSCAAGHSGAGPKVPDLCPGTTNGKPCGARCWRTNASGFPLHPPKEAA